MTDTRSAGRAGALLIPIALILAACSGASASGSPAAPGGTSGTTAPPAASTAPAASSSPSSAVAFPSFDIGTLASGLDKVDSYRVSITVNGTEAYSGIVVTKPVLSRDITMSGGTRVVVIGNEAWVGQGGGKLTAVPEAMATGMFAAFDPTLIIGAFAAPEWAQSSLDVGKEQKNGVGATHYHIDSTTLVGGFSGLPAGAIIDLWIADDGYLVAWESTGFGTGQTSIEVTGVDDPANKVDRPS